MIFGRETTLSNFNFPSSTYDEPFLEAFSRISSEIYGIGRMYELGSCPFIGHTSTLMRFLDEAPSQNPIVQECWLLFLPVCVNHKECIFCFQDPNDASFKEGMINLRKKVVEAASGLLSSIHHEVSTADGFLPPLIAITRALKSGCTLIIATSKQWTKRSDHLWSFGKCSEILTYFAPFWQGGRDYLGVWRAILKDLNDNPES